MSVRENEIIEIIDPGHGVAPVVIRIRPVDNPSDCSPPVHPHYDWPYNYFSTITCCGRMSDSQRRIMSYYSLEILPQYSNRGYLTIVCECWLITHFPEFFVLNMMKHSENFEYCSIRLEFIPCVDENDAYNGAIDRPSCHQCAAKEARFNLFSRQKEGFAPQPLSHFGIPSRSSPKARYNRLWEKGNHKWSQGHRWCLRCIYAHSVLFNLFDIDHLKILKRLWPRARYVKQARIDTSRHYAKDAYGPIALSNRELNYHRRRLDNTTQFFAYIKRIYGAEKPFDIIGGLKDPVARTSFKRAE